ncbi:MAG TPA: hypothetical protein VF532_06785 [Candidatus Angelobacter sp.]
MTSVLKVKLPAAIAIVALASYVVFLEVEASQDSDDKIGSSAVWDPGDQALQQIRESCKNGDPEDHTQCFIDHMVDAGASAEAVEFTQEYAQEHSGTIAILKNFHPLDAVDLGQAYFPEDKDEPWSVLLLNGLPEILDTSDVKLLPLKELALNPQYTALRGAHPQIGLFPGEDAHPSEASPQMQKLSGGGQRFVIDYTLREGCASCNPLGRATFSFDFNPAGQFQGARLIKVEPASALGPGK